MMSPTLAVTSSGVNLWPTYRVVSHCCGLPHNTRCLGFLTAPTAMVTVAGPGVSSSVGVGLGGPAVATASS